MNNSVLAVVVKDEPMPQLNLGGLQQLVHSLDEKHDEAHERLRHDYRELKAQLDAGLNSVRSDISTTRTNIATMAATPVDATKLVMAPRVAIAIAIMVVSVCSFVWGSTSGLKSDVRDILTRMDNQKTAVEAATKIQEASVAQVKSAIDDMKRRQELQQYEIQSLKEAVLTKAAAKQ